MRTKAISGLEPTEHLHFLQPLMAWGMPSWGQGCPQATPNTHRALGWPQPINFNFFGQKMALCMMWAQAISGLEPPELAHFLQPPMAWGMPSWGWGCPPATPTPTGPRAGQNHPPAPFFWSKNGNLAMAKNGKLIACVKLCGPLASCGPHPNGPKCAHGHQGGQGPTPCSPHGHPQIWQPYFQIWGVPHTH